MCVFLTKHFTVHNYCHSESINLASICSSLAAETNRNGSDTYAGLLQGWEQNRDSRGKLTLSQAAIVANTTLKH